jgi:hypothetical protein
MYLGSAVASLLSVCPQQTVCVRACHAVIYIVIIRLVTASRAGSAGVEVRNYVS